MDALQYSIDNGLNFSTNPIFLDVAPGTYETVLYSVTEQWNGNELFDVAQTRVVSSPSTALTASGGCRIGGLWRTPAPKITEK
jgi:hypothetical protein